MQPSYSYSSWLPCNITSRSKRQWPHDIRKDIIKPCPASPVKWGYNEPTPLLIALPAMKLLIENYRSPGLLLRFPWIGELRTEWIFASTIIINKLIFKIFWNINLNIEKYIYIYTPLNPTKGSVLIKYYFKFVQRHYRAEINRQILSINYLIIDTECPPEWSPDPRVWSSAFWV